MKDLDLVKKERNRLLDSFEHYQALYLDHIRVAGLNDAISDYGATLLSLRQQVNLIDWLFEEPPTFPDHVENRGKNDN